MSLPRFIPFGYARLGLGGLSALVSCNSLWFFFGQILFVGANLAENQARSTHGTGYPTARPHQKNLAPSWFTHAIQCMFLCGEPAAFQNRACRLVQ